MGIPRNPRVETTYSPDATDNSPLQKHVAFFDRDGDGIIWPTDTLLGFRRLGFNWLICIIAMVAIHTSMSYRTWNRLLPDPFFRLRLTAIHRGKHGSDSESYSHKGTFVQSNFDDLFTSWSTGPNHDTLTLGQVIAIPIGNSDPWDVFGFIAGLGEWLAVYVMFSPEDGKLKKEDVRGIFDGSAFYKVAKAVVAKKHRAY